MAKPPVMKPYNTGQWSEARYASFIKSALRRAMWPVKYQCLRNAYVQDGVNPKTGRRIKQYRCNLCKELFMQKELKVDHIDPVVCPLAGWVSWDVYISRLFCELDNLQAICTTCHDAKSAKERVIRDRVRKAKK